MAPDGQSLISEGRKKQKSLFNLQTNFKSPSLSSKWNLSNTNPTAEDTVKIDSPIDDKPMGLSNQAPAARIERRQSKISLFSLFAPPKVEKTRGYSEAGLQSIQEQPRPRSPQKHPRSPQKSFRQPKSQNPARALSSLGVATLDEDERRLSLVSRSSTRTTLTDGWAPPPLFQAYPQAIKYATLESSTVSVELLQKAQGHKKKLSALQEELGSSLDLTGSSDSILEKREQAVLHKKRLSTANFGPSILASKVYVLVTSGYLLQYAGEGNSNRMPEKVLSLKKESVAFASDLIPGKHFVLEVRETMEDNNSVLTVPTQPKGFFSRLRSQAHTAMKKQPPTMLLVLDSADAMISWMKAVRRVIDDFNGMSHKPTPLDEGKRDSLHSVEDKNDSGLSHRFRIQRNPRQFNDPNEATIVSRSLSTDRPSRSSYTVGHATHMRTPNEGQNLPTTCEASSFQSSKNTTPTSLRESLEASSLATSATTVSHEQPSNDQLRETSRMSFVSSRTPDTETPAVATSPVPSFRSSSPNAKRSDETDTSRGLISFRSSYRPSNSRSSPRRTFINAEVPDTAHSSDTSNPPLTAMGSSIAKATLESPVDPETCPEIPRGRLSSSHNPTSTTPVSSVQPGCRPQSALDHHEPPTNRVSAISTSSTISGTASTGESSMQQRQSTTVSTDSNPKHSLGALPNLSSTSSASNSLLAQDEDRTPSPRKRHSRPFPIPVKPSAALVPGHPVVPKRLSSLPSTLPPFQAAPSDPSRLPPRRQSGSSSPRIQSSPQAPTNMLRRLSLVSSPTLSAEKPEKANSVPKPPPTPIGSNNSSSTPVFHQPTGPVKAPFSRGLRRPMSLRVSSDQAAFLSAARPRASSSARRSFTAPANPASVGRPASAGAGRIHSPTPSMGHVLETVGETHVMKAIGPSDPRVHQPINPLHAPPSVADITGLRQHAPNRELHSANKRTPSPMGVKVRVSMPAVLEGGFIEGVNGIKIPISSRPGASARASVASPPVLPALPLPPPGAPPNCPLPSLPPPAGGPPNAPLPPVPAEPKA